MLQPEALEKVYPGLFTTAVARAGRSTVVCFKDEKDYRN
jgi:hypothetical protein